MDFEFLTRWEHQPIGLFDCTPPRDCLNVRVDVEIEGEMRLKRTRIDEDEG